MATRSRIAIENPNGEVTSIYCNWDGYFEGVGETLHKHFNEREKVEALIALGDISFLEENLGPVPGHSFETPAEKTTVAYHRDRGDDFHQEKHISAKSFFTSGIKDVQYGYLFTKEGKWMHKQT